MRVSIITPFYYGNEYITEYQEMLLLNEKNLEAGDEIEVILVNDSPSEAICLQGTTSAKRNWRVISNERNMGIHASRIHGLLEAKGDYVIFLDQDDVLREDAVATFLSFVRSVAKQATAGYQVIVANAVLEQKDSTSLWYRTDYHKKQVGNLKTYINVGTQIISPGQCLIPKGLIPEYWMTHICTKNGSDDYFLWLLMLEEGIPFLYLDEPLYEHHFTDKNLSSSTEVTDESNFQFISYMREDGVIPVKDIDALEKMLVFKAAFRTANKMGKIKLAVSRMSLMLINIIFKLKSHTRYGFNR